jgi:hypothetical protein
MKWDVHPGSGFLPHPGSRGQKSTPLPITCPQNLPVRSHINKTKKI